MTTARARADDWTRAVHEVVRRIPRGRVAPYGLVAVVAGRPRAARAVGNVMRACRDPDVPCHRVVRANGEPAFPRHAERLRREGVRFRGRRVEMSVFLWAPRLPSLRSSGSRGGDRARRAGRRR